jgi:lysophospholipase L1-like esterase
MKNILCFGDSITFGFDPDTSTRYPFEKRWTGVLQIVLGAEYRIIEEGLGSRTTATDDPCLPYRNGSDVLPMLLESHAPLDLVVIMLGTNDLKPYVHGSARQAAVGCLKLARQVMASQGNLKMGPPKILLLAPPVFGNLIGLMDTIFAETKEESKKFAQHYQNVANFLKINFLDTSALIVSGSDGIHLDAENNTRLAMAVAEKIKTIL